MNSLVVLAMLVMTLTSSVYQADASSMRLDKVVRALDALYKRQGGASGTTAGPGKATGPPQTTPGSGGASEYYSGSDDGGDCSEMGWGLWYMLREMQDQMFIKSIRGTLGGFNGICVDLFTWLDEHYYEYDMAHRGQSLGSMDSGSGGGASMKKRSYKLDAVKRGLRNLRAEMVTRQGGASGTTASPGGAGGASGTTAGAGGAGGASGGGSGGGRGGGMGSGSSEELNDHDIDWHKLFLSCYVWLHLD